MTMKKCLLFYLGLFFSVSQLSLAMDYDQDESEYGDNFGNGYSAEGIQQNSYNGFVQNSNGMQMQSVIPQNTMQNNGMLMQPGFVTQNGMQMQSVMPQNTIQNNGMTMQSGFMPQNMRQINNPMRVNRNNSLDNVTKQEHVQSLVNNILRVNGNVNSGTYGTIAKNNGIVINKNLKNKLLRLQKDLEEINKNLNNILQNESKDSSKKKKSTRASKKSAKRRNRRKKASTFCDQRNFYTVKQLTPQNARKYIPNSSNYSGRARKDDLYQSGIYRMKSWGTGIAVPSTPSYSDRSYFSNKSDCSNGCKSE
jgi:ElaB/YqjD/DUF883 family membrane-anchored ribosome-binding protein